MSTRTKKTSDSSEKLSRFPMVITDRTAVISVLGRPYSISRDAADFDAIRAAAQDPETTPAQMIALLSPKKAVEFALSKDGKVKVTKDGKFTVDGREVHNLIAKRLVELLREGFDVSPWLRFAESCIANPFQVDNILDELLPWAEKIKAPMTPRGGLLLFKKVKEDYFDSHTGCTHQNLIGATIEMESSKAQLDRSECGRGIHCSGWGYVHSFSGERIILIEVMPEDFIHVSIAHNKARVLKYVVVDEIERGPNGQFPTEQPIEYAPLVVIESIHEKKAVRKNGLNTPSLEFSSSAAPSDTAIDSGTPTTTKYKVLPSAFQNSGLRSRLR